MIEIDLLKNRHGAIPVIARIWYEVLGKIRMPEFGIEEMEQLYREELEYDMPLAYIALCDENCA